jgi:hypothetical protein
MAEYDYDDIRCYYDEDIPTKLWPLADRPEIQAVIKAGFPEVNMDQVKALIRSCNTVKEFQTKVIIYFLDILCGKCTDGVEAYGIENIDDSYGHLYVTNHRDIVLDSALLNVMLSKHGKETSEIAIGNNLFAAPWIEDLVRVNKSFVVRRDLTGRQLLQASIKMSSYIHQEIVDKKCSIWMAQREGRSKDNSDNTQASVIKMLSLGGESKDHMQNIRALHTIPVAISYEYDPCDYLKAAEFQLKRDDPEWKKTKADDVKSMATGMTGYKGRIRYTFTKELNGVFDQYPWINDKNAQVNCVCQTIDNMLHDAMVLYPINYVAYDMKYQTERYCKMYTEAEKNKAVSYLNGQLAKIDIPNRDEVYLWDMLLTMYSNPVYNKEKLVKQQDTTAIPLT